MDHELNKMHRDIIDKFYETLHTGKASSNIEEIVPASFYGRVSQLLVEKNENIWGQVDKQTKKVKSIDKFKQGYECLMNTASIQTILNGGEVILLNKEQMPQGSLMSAIYRY